MAMAGEDALALNTDDLALTPAEQLTANFYNWEQRGRGWQLWDYPVELEPPFRPFIGHFPPAMPAVDDTRRHTLMSGLVAWLRQFFMQPAHAASTETGDTLEEPEPTPFRFEDLPVELQLSIPPTAKTSRKAAEQVLLSLPHTTGPISFEIVGTASETVVQFACGQRDHTQLRGQLRSYFSESVITDPSNYFIQRWRNHQAGKAAVVDFGLSDEFMLPVRTFRGFEVDPLIGVIGALENLQGGETGILQLLFRPVRKPWAEHILRAVTDWDGTSFFADAPAIADAARKKVSHPLFAAVLRVGARAATKRRAWQIVRAVGGALRQYASPTSNEFIPLTNDNYDDETHELDLLARTTHRSGLILGSDELVGLVHLPSASVHSRKLVRETRKTKAAPTITAAHALVLGENRHAGKQALVSLSPRHRARHVHVVGASGTGKSHLLLNLIIQDIEAGNGVGVLDPHGDLIDRLLPYIPEDRADDVILFDPADETYPIGFNILSAHSTLEKQLLSSDLVAVFQRLSTSWGDRMTSVLGNAILAFLESERGGTLADLRRFLVEKDFRNQFLATVTDPEVVYYWQKEFPLLSGRPQAPLLTRLDTFLRPRLIRNIVAQQENRLNFARMMNESTIFLGKLAEGLIGEENAHLLGTLLVSKCHQTALSRQNIQHDKRKPFYLYIDEFHHFVTPTLATVLSGARKYGLGLTLAHQDLHQLFSRDQSLGAAVLTNPATRICFRVGDLDAQKLESGFASFDAKDLQSLGRGEAICRVERRTYDFNLHTLPLPDLDPEVGDNQRDAVIAASRTTYGTPLSEVEATPGRARPTVTPPSASTDSDKHEKQPTPDSPDPPKETPVKPPDRPAASPPQERSSPARPKEVPAEESSKSAKLGRGGRQHTYLQELIKRWAQTNGWRATIEQSILDGLGSVDIALELEDTSIACEISVTSTPEHELANVQKCLAAGFGDVIVVSADEKDIDKLATHVSDRLEEKDRPRVHFLTPEALFSFLSEKALPGSDEVVGGYNVEVRFRAGSEEEQDTRRQAISHVILQALRRMRGGSD